MTKQIAGKSGVSETTEIRRRGHPMRNMKAKFVSGTSPYGKVRGITTAPSRRNKPRYTLQKRLDSPNLTVRD